MNRPDHASDPSMEDILASIRRIISDNDQNESPQAIGRGPEDYQGRAPAAATLAAQPADEEVLDLTDELVFALEQPQPSSHVEETGAGHEAEGSSSRSGESQRPPEKPSAPAASTREKSFSHHAAPHLAPAPSSTRSETRQSAQRAAPAPSRPIWSRREFQKSEQDGANRGRLDNPRAAEKPMAQPQAAWAEDIQIPVPDQGPIPLMGRADAHAAYDSAPRASAGRDGATVAALAHTLAKTAVVALEDEELVEAREVNFEHIDPSKRTDVSERFADAMQEPGSEPSPFLQPGLLDEVLRNEFPREAAPPSDDQDELLDLSEFPEPPLEANLPAPQAETAFDPAQQEWWQVQEKGERMEQPQLQKHTVETPMQRTLTQAQFTGAELAQAPAVPGRSLEDSIRDMLRPLLVQWLNDNMPRILENAIREEIAQRGLLPKQN